MQVRTIRAHELVAIRKLYALNRMKLQFPPTTGTTTLVAIHDNRIVGVAHVLIISARATRFGLVFEFVISDDCPDAGAALAEACSRVLRSANG